MHAPVKTSLSYNPNASVKTSLFIQSDLVNPDPFVPGGFVRIREMYGLTSSINIENSKSVLKKSWLD